MLFNGRIFPGMTKPDAGITEKRCFLEILRKVLKEEQWKIK